MESFEPKVLALYLTRHGSERMKEMVSLSPVSSLVGMESSTYEFERKAIQHHPDILFIEYDPAFPGLMDLIERLTRSLPKGGGRGLLFHHGAGGHCQGHAGGGPGVSVR